jgi:hypothetical protein
MLHTILGPFRDASALRRTHGMTGHSEAVHLVINGVTAEVPTRLWAPPKHQSRTEIHGQRLSPADVRGDMVSEGASGENGFAQAQRHRRLGGQKG